MPFRKERLDELLASMESPEDFTGPGDIPMAHGP